MAGSDYNWQNTDAHLHLRERRPQLATVRGWLRRAGPRWPSASRHCTTMQNALHTNTSVFSEIAAISVRDRIAGTEQAEDSAQTFGRTQVSRTCKDTHRRAAESVGRDGP